MPLVKVGNARIQLRDSMKYLGVMLDSRWTFKCHFQYVENKLATVTRALSRLMPNLRGPGEKKRRLYAGVLTSVAMYAAPVWCEALARSSDKTLRLWRRIQRSVAIRVITAYRTVSYDAATLLARMPPWPLEAAKRGRIYTRIVEHKRRGTYDEKIDIEIRNGETLLLYRQWEILISRTEAWGQKTLVAIGPHLRKWMERIFGQMNYYSAQMLSGHGSFGHFLCRIGKRQEAACFHCPNLDDTLEHTLLDCPAWNVHRHKMVSDVDLNINTRITLERIVEKILMGEEQWTSFVQFSTIVIKLKEEEERRREGGGGSPAPLSPFS